MRKVSGWLLQTVAILICAAAPAGLWAQNRATTAKPWTPPLTSDGQPDLQGVWTDTSATPLERPKAFAGRAVLTDEEVKAFRERAARLQSDSTNDFLAGDNLFLFLTTGLEKADSPNATGTAADMVVREIDNRTSLITDPPDGRLPPVTPQGATRQAAGQAATLAIPWQPGQDAATVQRQTAAATARPTPAGPEDLTNWLRCITWGVPRLAGNANYTSHYEIVQSPGYVVLLSEVNHEARVVPLDSRPHLAQNLRQWTGDSRGHWEGQTLVIDTTNFSSRSYFLGAAESLHLTERLTRTGPDTMDYAITVDDRTTWTTRWTAVVRLKRRDEQLFEFACHEGNYDVMRSILGGARSEDRARALAGKR